MTFLTMFITEKYKNMTETLINLACILVHLWLSEGYLILDLYLSLDFKIEMPYLLDTGK